MLWTFMSLPLLCDWFIFLLHQFSHAAHFGGCFHILVFIFTCSAGVPIYHWPPMVQLLWQFSFCLSVPSFLQHDFEYLQRPFPLFHPCLVLKSSTFMWCLCTVCSPAWFWSLFRCCDSPECCALRTCTDKSHDFIKLLPFLYLTSCVRFILVVVACFSCVFVCVFVVVV